LRLIIPAILIAILPASSYASSPISHVGGATVNEGQSSVEFRLGYTQDEENNANDNRLRMRQHFDYGFNDWYALRIIAAQDKRDGESFEHQAVTIENRFQLIERRDHGWDGGIRLIYTQSDGDKTPHEIEMRFLAQVPIAKHWEFRHNTMIEHDIGDDAENGILLEFRHQLTREVEPPHPLLTSFDVGVEIFNDFGRLNRLSGYSAQDHQFGPVAKGTFTNDVFFQTGYRAGISDAGANHVFALSIGKKF
jgi:hypothetical protein